MPLTQATAKTLAFDASARELLEPIERRVALIFACPGVRHGLPSEEYVVRWCFMRGWLSFTDTASRDVFSLLVSFIFSGFNLSRSQHGLFQWIDFNLELGIMIHGSGMVMPLWGTRLLCQLPLS